MDAADGGGVVASVGELLDDGLGFEVVEDGEEAARASEELKPSPAEPITIEPNSFYLSTGFGDGGQQQCGFVWRALRVMAAPEQLVRARLLFSDDAYWNWWAGSPGVAGAIFPSTLLRVCADDPRGVEAPAGCDELIHVSDARRLEAEDVPDVFSNCLRRNPGAVWPADLPGPRAARLAAPRRAARPKKESAAPPTPVPAGPSAAKHAAEGHDAPFDGLLGDSALAARAAGLPLDLEPARDELRARLAAARDWFATAAPGAAAAGAPPVRAEAAPSEDRPKKRGLAEALAERMAKVAKGPAEATRGSGGPAAAAAASGGAAGEGAKKLATAPMAAKMAQDQPGKLSEPTPMQMAAFLCAVESDAAVDPTTALLPQNPAPQIGVVAHREMRALAGAIDFLLQGKPTTLRNEEEEMIRSIELGELKLEELSSRLRKPQGRTRAPGNRTPARPKEPKGSAKEGERPPHQRVAQLDKTAKKLPAGGSQAPLNSKAARDASPKKNGETSMEYKARLRIFMAESRGQKRWQTLPRLLEVAVQFGATIAGVDTAVHLAQLAERHPGSLGDFSGEFAERLSTLSGGGRRVRDLLPLPLPSPPAARPGARAEMLGTSAEPGLSLGSGATVDCAGEPMAKALPCAPAELAPGSPQPEHTAALGALEFVKPDVAEWPTSPEKALFPEADWPDPMLRTRADVADEDQLARARDEPLLNGLFAVEMRSKPGPGAERAARLILNMVPGHALLKPHAGEASLLAASTNWVPLHTPEGKLLLWSGDDQKGAFFVWRILKVHIASAAIAAGWASAAPAPQHIHRRLRRQPPPRGAGLPPELEWRKDEARPIVELGSGREAGWWQLHIGDFDAPEIADEARARQFVDTEADCQQRVRESYKRAGAAYAAEKAHLRETRVERMGADVDGVSGRPAAPRPKVLSSAALCLATLSQERVPWRVCMTALGKLVRAFEFRRPLFGLLDSAWFLSTARSTVRCNAEMVEELLLGLMLLPTAVTSLRARNEGMVTVSDASEFGGGACASTSLRGEAASALKSVGQVADHLGVGARLLNMLVDPRCPWTVSHPRIPRAVALKVLNVLVVGLFDGIGGLAVSPPRLPVRIVAYVTAETDAKARRVVRLRWPGAIDWGDVTRVDDNLVQDLFDAFSESADACVAGAGSPRQDLLRLNARGGGLHGRKSSLFYEVPRIFRLLQQAFGRLRLSWLGRHLQVTPPLRPADRGYYIEVMTDNGPLLDIEWGQGVRWAGRPPPFPTLVRCRPFPSFPSAPRGLAPASSEARARWQAESPRYHVARHEGKNIAQDCSGRLPGRLPSCTERERLLGFDEGYTAVATKSSKPQAASGARAFLLGNSSASMWSHGRCSTSSWRSPLRRAPLSVPEIARVGQRRETWDQRGCFEDSAGDPNTEGARRLALQYLSRATHAHINAREAQAALAAMRWRARKSARHCTRWLHFVDNQVVAAIVAKGRSNSRRLQPALRRYMAMAIAADVHPLIGHVVSEDNPADEPSRKLWRGSRLRKRGEEVRLLGGEAEDADSLVASCLEAIWQSGAGIALANNTVVGVCFLLSKLRRRLDLSRALRKAWRRAEPAERAPFTPDIVAGMAGLAAEAGAFDVSCLLLISFEGLLRGGEAFALTTDDVLDRGDSVALRI
ncbi:unnamed protein product, partial [Prorocentrum cordatum]